MLVIIMTYDNAGQSGAMQVWLYVWRSYIICYRLRLSSHSQTHGPLAAYSPWRCYMWLQMTFFG